MLDFYKKQEIFSTVFLLFSLPLYHGMTLQGSEDMESLVTLEDVRHPHTNLPRYDDF